MPRIALGLEYDGVAFSGWQSQKHARGVQSTVEAALSFVADHPIDIVAAGRTDAGVHACMQVVHFDTHAERSERAWTVGCNSRLPSEVSALWARVVPNGFHARYGALSRSYRYLILNRAARPALERVRACWIRETLDEARMHSAAQHLVGEHDFSSFRAAECQSRTPMRRLYSIAVERKDNVIAIHVTANAFLQHMVRNIAGVLIAVGRAQQATTWPKDLLILKDRTQGGITAPACGLYLVGVKYAEALQLPSEAPPSDW